MRALRAMTRVEALLFLRNPTAVFMALLLPTLLLALQAFVIPGTLAPLPGGGGLRAIDYFVPVAIAVAVTSVSITNYPAAIGAYRETGVLRRLGVTPVGPHRVLLANWMVSVVALAIAILIALMFARIGFHLTLPVRPGLAIAIVAGGVIAMMALGSLIAAVASSAQIAYGIGLLVFMGCIFTAGMWTPGPLMPDGLRIVSSVTPLGATTQALTAAWYGGELSPLTFVVMLVWAVPAALLALRVFRWV